jgi:uncharacterized membrane protein YdjX (TVP38/TMEM64 family)
LKDLTRNPILGAKLAGKYFQGESKMTKKASIFKWLISYFRNHPGTAMGWAWVSTMPLVGSFLLPFFYPWLDSLVLDGLWMHVALGLGMSLLVSLAILPSTLTALTSGFFWGWEIFPTLLVSYLLANALGYTFGKFLHADFKSLLYQRNPTLQQEIETRIARPAGLIFFVRISPVVPFSISNFLFASLGIPLKKVLQVGLLGMLPRTSLAFATGQVAQSILDAQTSMKQPYQWAFLAFFMLLSLWGIWYSWKKGSRKG